MDAVFSMIDIVPYLDVETASLSSVVYWPGLLAGSRLLAAAISRIVFSDLVHLGTDEMILQVIRARLSSRSKGYVDVDHPGYENDGGARIQGITIRESAAKGMQLETWLRGAAVEHLFRLRLGAEYNVIERGLRGLGSAKEVSRVRALVEVMVKNGRCLGDGPWWKTDRVAAILESWEVWNGSDSPVPF